MRDEWAESLHREGSLDAYDGAQLSANGELPCPACGTAAPLDEEGACTDCGLVLA